MLMKALESWGEEDMVLAFKEISVFMYLYMLHKDFLRRGLDTCGINITILFYCKYSYSQLLDIKTF